MFPYLNYLQRIIYTITFDEAGLTKKFRYSLKLYDDRMKRAFPWKIAMKLAVLAGIFLTLFAVFEPILATHSYHGDEGYYVGRSVQYIEFIEGKRSPQGVWFSSGNHPFSGELIIGLSLVVQNEIFKAPDNPWLTNLTSNQLVAARRSALFTGLVGLTGLVYLALEFHPLIAFTTLVFLLSSAGFVDFSLISMLDIFVATFTALTLVSLYFYVVKGNRRGLWLSSVFLGLSLGSKTSWDPILAGLLVYISVFYCESSFGTKGTLITVLKSFALAFSAFSLTSSIIVIRLADHINSVVGPHGSRVDLIHMFTDQPLVSISNYTIFGAQSPANLFMFGAVVSCLVALVLMRKLDFLTGKPRASFYLAIVCLYVVSDMILTASTFEYGRNYARLALYEALFMTVFFGFLYKQTKRVGLIATLIFAVAGSYILKQYLDVLATSYLQTGSALFSPQIISKEASFATLVGWFTLSSIALAAPIFGFVILSYLPLDKTKLRIKLRKTKGMSHRLPKFSGQTEPKVDVSGKSTAESAYSTGTCASEQVLESKQAIVLSEVMRTLKLIKGAGSSSEIALILVNFLQSYGNATGYKGLTIRQILNSATSEYQLSDQVTLKLAEMLEAQLYGGYEQDFESLKEVGEKFLDQWKKVLS